MLVFVSLRFVSHIFYDLWLTLNAYLAVIGTIEELAASQNTQTLIREQFETNFFGPVNIIKAALPAMREKRAGHIIALTGISMRSLQLTLLSFFGYLRKADML